MRAICTHLPRRMVSYGQKHKDGSAQLVCADCKSTWGKRYNRKRNGFQMFWDAQHGMCAFCGQPLADDNTTHLDHNHKTGRKRGLVHAQCNQMIGGVEAAFELVSVDHTLRYLGLR